MSFAKAKKPTGA